MKLDKKSNVIFRVDDVFLTDGLTGSMKNSLRYGTFFENFKKMDKIFEEHNAPCTLAVLANGISKNPEWVRFVKERQHRYTIEMHGFYHCNYAQLPEEMGKRLLTQAKEAIEKEFGVKVTRWYVPFSRRGCPEWGPRVCEELGIGFHHKKQPGYILHFHYWNSRDHRRLKAKLPIVYAKQHP